MSSNQRNCLCIIANYFFYEFTCECEPLLIRTDQVCCLQVWDSGIYWDASSYSPLNRTYSAYVKTPWLTCKVQYRLNLTFVLAPDISNRLRCLFCPHTWKKILGNLLTYKIQRMTTNWIVRKSNPSLFFWCLNQSCCASWILFSLRIREPVILKQKVKDEGLGGTAKWWDTPGGRLGGMPKIETPWLTAYTPKGIERRTGTCIFGMIT